MGGAPAGTGWLGRYSLYSAAAARTTSCLCCGRQPNSSIGQAAAAAVAGARCLAHQLAGGLRLGAAAASGQGEASAMCQRLPHSKAHWFSRRTSSSCSR